ncbi:hypothetical protein POM88_019634 [Heracleum sosnowskyi]|uniref:Uncharacterized protein n=1 Tax=Heracleum sosnowskyi TaxID=360622 RepID=A0AAD8IB91_9APIA|nr:hypothetical protein POM88_019634 [Heracleum sosnowskyi]
MGHSLQFGYWRSEEYSFKLNQLQIQFGSSSLVGFCVYEVFWRTCFVLIILFASTKQNTYRHMGKDDAEIARTAAINHEIKRVLTEVLLKVTDELFDEIATNPCIHLLA